MVSHDISQVRALCDRVIWLRDGRVAAVGDPQDVVSQYESAAITETEKRGSVYVPVRQTRSGHELCLNENRKGTMEMEITDVQLLDGNGALISELQNGDGMVVEIAYAPRKNVHSPIFSVTIKNKEDAICLDTNTDHLEMPDIVHDGIVRVRFDRLDLTAGEYFVDVGAYAIDWGHVYDYHWHVYPLSVRDAVSRKGMLNPRHRWDFPHP
jgi:lipopolysaccharide transport system ATP-binding protein